MDAVFKALADGSRRKLLDRLRKSNGQTLTELCGNLAMTRQAVAKHLALLESANLVATVWRGREKLHYLNPVPLHEVYERWIGKYERHRLSVLSGLKQDLEKPIIKKDTMDKPQFVYVTYIETTPEKLWEALTTAEFTRQYWFDSSIESEWKVGEPVLFRRDGEITDEQVLLKYEPPRLLSYTWHSLINAEYRKEKPSRVTFEIESLTGDGPLKGAGVRLTVTHDDFPPASKVFPAISKGWPVVLSNLKTLLETSKPMNMAKEKCG